MITREGIVAEARTWIGTKWQHQTSLKGVATDCVGLVGGIPRTLGMTGGDTWDRDPAFTGYGRTPDPKLLLTGCDKYLIRAPEGAPYELADILVMRAREISEPTHFAIVSRLDPTYIIHSRMLHSVAENRLSKQIEILVLRVYRYKGIQ